MVLLKRVKDEICLKVIQMIDAHTYVSLVTDGWTDTNGSIIINFMVVTPGLPSLFWSSWSTSGGCSAHVLNLLMQDIYNFPAIKAVLSSAVTLTRLVRDHLALYDEFKQLQQDVRDMGSKARNLVLPIPTLWYSMHACLRNVLNSRETLEKLFLNPDYELFMARYRGTTSNRKKLLYMIALIRDDVFWNNLRTIVRLFNPIIDTLCALEADNAFDSAVYQRFRGGPLRIDQQQALNGIGVLSDVAAIVTPVAPVGNGVALDEASQADGTYTNPTAVRLDHLQGLFREKIQKRWRYVHTDAMAVGFLLDPSMNIDDFVGCDDEQVDDQVCSLAERCGLITSTGVAALTAEILSFKCLKRRGGEALRAKYSESSPRGYWGAQSENKYPLLKKLANIVFAMSTSSAASERAWSIFDHIHSKRRNRMSVEKVEMLAFVYINYGALQKDELDLARHQSCPEGVDTES
ncbi:unnamed protein product [Phytophthora fragariaefolia]|uniref:Unnamed protein product n=1 Tax=Phytophthora fragariaefolia TaxID=1490495 RepID=A0A9W6Y5P0_9STRA|nr:unnamed protein product [Phytophthora fragariaefolia]